jgi:hypothetical protein
VSYQHPYLRAYMAGVAVPTVFLVVVLTVFCVARFVYNVPAPIERVMVFPMALVPNVFGLWNILYLFLKAHYRYSLGLHGALLPFIVVPTGFFLGSLLGIQSIISNGFLSFNIRLTYLHAAVAFGAVVVIYYLVWKHIIGFLNELLGIG